MVIVLVFKLAEMTIYSNLPIIEKIIFFLFVWLFLSFLIWILGFIAPDLQVLAILGLKNLAAKLYFIFVRDLKKYIIIFLKT